EGCTVVYDAVPGIQFRDGRRLMISPKSQSARDFFQSAVYFHIFLFEQEITEITEGAFSNYGIKPGSTSHFQLIELTQSPVGAEQWRRKRPGQAERFFRA